MYDEGTKVLGGEVHTLGNDGDLDPGPPARCSLPLGYRVLAVLLSPTRSSTSQFAVDEVTDRSSPRSLAWPEDGDELTDTGTSRASFEALLDGFISCLMVPHVPHLRVRLWPWGTFIWGTVGSS